MGLESNQIPASCPKCGQRMRAGNIKTAIWQGERVFLIEDIPAMTCDSCLDQFYDDEVTEALRRLTEDGFPSLNSVREVLVPVFSLAGIFAVDSPES